MAFFKWFQREGGDESWSLMLAEHEAQVVSQKKPAFTTILAADFNFEGTADAERMSQVKYKGDLYFDFDTTEGLAEVIPQFQKFLRNLQKEYGFDLQQARLYASGGKGFHVTIPIECLVAKPAGVGYQYLPAVYKEMAYALIVDMLDMRVYTARKGRMFRTANVERPDRKGVYKVPLSVEEAFSITPEIYKELCSAPRMDITPNPPSLNLDLSLLFEKSRAKVLEASKAKKKSKADAGLIQSFKGQFPPSVIDLMQGNHVNPDMGFQKIALQLSLLAHTLGKTEAQLLEACEGLCKNHSSDGVRYNTPKKRERELSRMYQYMHENPCYEFSMGGIKALFEKDFPTNDLKDGGGDFGDDIMERPPVDEAPPPMMDGEYYHEFDEPESHNDDDGVINLGLKVTTKGMWRKSEEGMIKICAVGLGDPKLLIDMRTGDHIGYEVDAYKDGKLIGPKFLTMDCFLSRQKFMSFTLSVGGTSMNATDAQVGALSDVLSHVAHRNNKVVYTTAREGLDVVTTFEGEVKVLWVDRYGVADRFGENKQFKLRTTWTKNPFGDYKTDLRKAPDLVNNEETREFFHCLFDCNDPEVVAKMLGWFVSAFFCQIIRFRMNQFPMLMVEGQAGSGKSSLVSLAAQMHYWHTEVKKQSAAGQRVFGLEVALTSSASIPLIMEEYKPREMKKDNLDRLKDAMRHNYEGKTTLDRGSVTMQTGASQLETRGPVNAAPLCFVGEAPELQASIQDRIVHVSMSHEGQRGRHRNFLFCQNKREILSSFGRNVARLGLRISPDEVAEELTKEMLEVTAKLKESHGMHRVIFNGIVSRFGLKMMQHVLHNTFDDLFDAKIEKLIEAIRPGESMTRTMSEIDRVLNVMAQMSEFTAELENNNRLVHGEDYAVLSGEESDMVHLNLMFCYTKYVRYVRSIGQYPLYDNLEAFVHALRQHKAVVDTVPSSSPVRQTTTTRVYVLEQAKLSEENISLFKGDQR